MNGWTGLVAANLWTNAEEAAIYLGPNKGELMSNQRGPRRRFDLKKALFVLPSLITLSSVFCGFDAIRIAAAGKTVDDFYRAALLIIFAMFFDMLDGRVARMTRTQTAFGLQLDSLADMVSFGLAPAVLVYNWSLKSQPTLGLIVAFMFVAGGAVRLARFNVLSMNPDGKPAKSSKYFLGLPIPGAAGILISIVVADQAAQPDLGGPAYTWAMMAVTVVLSFLMISNVRFRSFKDMKLNVRSCLLIAFALGSSVIVASQFEPAFVLLWLMSVYVLVAIVESVVSILPKLTKAGRKSVPPG